MKICPRCKRSLPISAFQKNRATSDGLQYHCKDCLRQFQKEGYAKKRAAEGKPTPAEKRAAKVAAREAMTAAKVEKRAAKIAAKLAEKERRKAEKAERSAERREAHRLRDNDRRNLARFLETPEEYQARLANDRANKKEPAARARRRDRLTAKRQTPEIRLAKIIGDQMRRALQSGKDRRWSQYVGYTVAELRAHLEAQFEPWMTWENYGTAWHIDHKRPVASFMLEDAIEVSRCWSLENLRPLACFDNIAKGNKIDPAIIAELPEEFHPAFHVIFGEAA